MLLRSDHPPSLMIRSGISSDNPGAHVICVTARLLSSHWLAFTGSSAPMIGGIRALTLDAGHISRDGTKM